MRLLPFVRPEPRPQAPPMRQMVTRVCLACDHRWLQPNLDGRCPKCHSAATSSVKAEMCQLPRAN